MHVIFQVDGYENKSISRQPVVPGGAEVKCLVGTVPGEVAVVVEAPETVPEDPGAVGSGSIPVPENRIVAGRAEVERLVSAVPGEVAVVVEPPETDAEDPGRQRRKKPAPTFRLSPVEVIRLFYFGIQFCTTFKTVGKKMGICLTAYRAFFCCHIPLPFIVFWSAGLSDKTSIP